MNEITRLALVGAAIFAAYKWGNPMMRAGALAVGAVAVAKRVPYVREVL